MASTVRPSGRGDPSEGTAADTSPKGSRQLDREIGHGLRFLALALVAAIATAAPAAADQEISNTPHVAAGPSGRCYARSVPAHIYDPDDDRQAGTTSLFVVNAGGDVLVHRYPWFSQQLLVLCNFAMPERSILVRIGPWPRGDTPNAADLALAFYASGALIRRYSTRDIVEIVARRPPCADQPRAFLQSVSHYAVLGSVPTLEAVTTNEGVVFRTEWRVRTSDLCDRPLLFEPASGELVAE